MDIDSSNLNDSDKETDASDIRDIEFQLMHNLNELQVNMLKLSNNHKQIKTFQFRISH